VAVQVQQLLKVSNALQETKGQAEKNENEGARQEK
jgi:hypothetical protein